MFASLIRIAILIGLGFGAYKLYPQYKPIIQKQVENPAVLGDSVAPIIDSLNNLLPSTIQIPQILPTISPTNQTVENKTPQAVQNLIDDVKVKTNQVAQEQLDIIKKEASKQFCSVLLEKIKTECDPNL